MNLKNTIITTSLGLLGSWSVQASSVYITATVESLAPENSVTFAPLHVGFNNGTFDGFDIGAVAANTPLQTLAETGSGADWLPAFAAADPTAVLGTIGSILTPGSSASASFLVDTDINPYFTFAAMVVPSNDFFIGNDSPMAYHLLDNDGNLLMNDIVLSASDIWDAGTEVYDPATAAFVGNAGLHADQNSVVALNFAEFAAYNGLTTAAGYTFNSQLSANTEIYRISFETSPVPLPASLPLFTAALGSLGVFARRRRSR